MSGELEDLEEFRVQRKCSSTKITYKRGLFRNMGRQLYYIWELKEIGRFDSGNNQEEESLRTRATELGGENSYYCLESNGTVRVFEYDEEAKGYRWNFRKSLAL